MMARCIVVWGWHNSLFLLQVCWMESGERIFQSWFIRFCLFWLTMMSVSVEIIYCLGFFLWGLNWGKESMEGFWWTSYSLWLGLILSVVYPSNTLLLWLRRLITVVTVPTFGLRWSAGLWLWSTRLLNMTQPSHITQQTGSSCFRDPMCVV